MLILNDYIDVIIPRGGIDLINFVVSNATVLTIETGVGNCHIYVDDSANIEKAINIVNNAKVQKPGVCNACETILVHENIASKFLPKLYNELSKKVELRGCPKTKEIINIKEAIDTDWLKEYLDYTLAIKVVSNINKAIQNIQKYGTKHSEAIITENLTNANYFLRRIDAATILAAYSASL